MSVSRMHNLVRITVLGLILALASGCASTQGPGRTTGNDPIEPANRVFFDVNETLDKHLLKPIAEGYVAITPQPVRTAVTNFFNNLAYLNVILNSFLQGKFNQGITDTLRFVYNSTFGIGGLFDISTDIGMPANNEDFGQTLAVWGFDSGSYLYIPLFGPNTVRDSTNIATSILLKPFTYISAALWPVNAINTINTRANLLEASNLRDEAAVDPYTFTREAYIQQREYFIYNGNPPVSDFEDFFTEEDSLLDESEEGVLVIE